MSMICGGELAQTLLLVVVVLSVYDLWRRTGSDFCGNVCSGYARCLLLWSRNRCRIDDALDLCGGASSAGARCLFFVERNRFILALCPEFGVVANDDCVLYGFQDGKWCDVCLSPLY